jgi:eukaryotic-like serine/threonine-protein kinase
MKFREFLRELHRRNVWKVAVAYTAAAVVLLEVLTHLFHNFEAPHWVLKVITTLLMAGLPLACLAAWGFEVREGRVRSVPREPQETKPALLAPVTTAPPSIAVLPFADMSAEHDQQYLGDGIAEELLNALASIEGLNVAARTSSFSFAGKGASIEEIGRTLHVRHVLEGSVRKSGQKLRVTAQLINVETGFHCYSQTYDRPVQDIFDIQNEIAREIVAALLPRLGVQKDATLITHGTNNLEAYNMRLRARQWITQPSPATYREIIGQLRQATRLDPAYAGAWSDLAYILGFTSAWMSDPMPNLLEAHHAVETALRIKPDDMLALLGRAFLRTLVYRDAKAADHWYEIARAAGGDLSVWAFNRAVLFDHPLGQWDRARPALEEAARIDPLSHNVKWPLAFNYERSGRHADAVRLAEELRDLRVASPDGIASVAMILKDPVVAAGARDSLAAMIAAAPDELANAGHLYQFSIDEAIGDRTHARQLLDKLLAEDSAERPASPVVIAEGYKALGEYDRAIDWWSRAVDQHLPYTLGWMAMMNRMHPVIGKHPRFLALLKRMGLEGDQTAAG